MIHLLKLRLVLLAFGLLLMTSCGKETGCTDPQATNYNPDAEEDDGTCIIPGCTDPLASNYNPSATEDNGSCIIPGCTDPLAANYDPSATEDSGVCIYPGCTDPLADNYDPNANSDDDSCIFSGCTDVNSDQYDMNANVEDGSCETYFERWTGTWTGDFLCDGQFLDQYFGDASMSFSKVEEDGNLDSMEVFIEFSLSDLPLNFGSTITRDTMTADGYFEGIEIDSVDILPNLPEVYNIALFGKLGISEDNETIQGRLTVEVVETASGTNFEFTDNCTFLGTKE